VINTTEGLVGASVDASYSARHWSSSSLPIVSPITAEEKYKLLKDGTYSRHVYYHCTKRKDPNCTEKYVNETDMQDQIK